jgi:hypothetical protein
MDRFEIKNKLGVGSFGVVMLARYKENGHEVRSHFSTLLLRCIQRYTHSSKKLAEEKRKDVKKLFDGWKAMVAFHGKSHRDQTVFVSVVA